MENDTTNQGSAALLLAATRALAITLPHASAEDHLARAKWAISRGSLGLDSSGALYFVPSGLEDAKKAGFISGGADAIIDTRTPREKRDARIRETQKILSDRYAASRKPKERPDISKEFNRLVAEDPSLQGAKGRDARAKLREELYLAAGVGVGS